MNWEYYIDEGIGVDGGTLLRRSGGVVDYYDTNKWVNMFGINKHTNIEEFIKSYNLKQISREDAMLKVL